MFIKRSHIYFLIIFASVLFAGGSFAFAQTTSFVEPGQGISLAVPLSASSAPQAIDTALGLGISADSELATGTKLFVKGTALTKPQEGVGKIADVVIDKSPSGSAESPSDSADGTTFSIQGSNVHIVGAGATCPANGAKVCVMETENRPAVNILQQTGVGLFGQTSVAGRAGVYGQGYYGVEAIAIGDPSIIALKSQSCTVSGGSNSFCLTDGYGTAGFFDGDFVIDDQGSSSSGTVTGALNGNGENLYRVESLYNTQEGTTPKSKGIAFKSFGVISDIVVGANTSNDLENILADDETFISINVVESSDDTVFSPAVQIKAQYDPVAKKVVLVNDTKTAYHVRAVMSYLKANN